VRHKSVPQRLKPSHDQGIFGTAKQAAEKSDFGKTAKNKSRQDALEAIRWVSVMILYLHFWGHLCPIPTFSAACKAVP
jgi:hypothetical protein